MRVLLPLVLSGMAMSACAEPTPASLSELFRAACIDTDSERSAIAALAAERGWQEIPFHAGDDGPQWGVGYSLGYARVMLVGYNSLPEGDVGVTDGPMALPARITCAVDFRDAPSDWREQAAEVADSLGFSPLDPSDNGDVAEVRHWAREEARLTSRYDASTGIVSLEVTRITDPEIVSMLAAGRG